MTIAEIAVDASAKLEGIWIAVPSPLTVLLDSILVRNCLRSGKSTLEE